MCRRGTHEKVYGELKSGFAFACVPTQHFEANSAWQVLSIMAFNLMRGFQANTGAEPRRSNRKRRAIHRFDLIHTLRYEFLNRAGLLVNPNGRATLDVGDNEMVRERFPRLGSNGSGVIYVSSRLVRERLGEAGIPFRYSLEDHANESEYTWQFGTQLGRDHFSVVDWCIAYRT